MKIDSITIKNFRLLKEVTLSLQEQTTLVVGRNNSGKTSLTELLRRLVAEKKAPFSLEDFSLGAYKDFWDAFLLFSAEDKEEEVRKVLPSIEVRLSISYEKEAENLGALGDFIIDLNSECTTATAIVIYQLGDGKIKSFFEGLTYNTEESMESQRKIFFKIIKERISKYYGTSVIAEDPNDVSNRKDVDLSRFRALLNVRCINAERGLDDETTKDNDVLGKILETVFTSASSENATDKDKDVATALREAVKGIEGKIDEDMNLYLTKLIPTFNEFGYPGLKDQKLMMETTLDVERLLSNHTKVRYAGEGGINLPESFNGLGIRNLIYILLRLFEFFKEYKNSSAEIGVNLIFIEEPEAHLHPQMQEVFIRKVSEIIKFFEKDFEKKWSVQFVVSTHSSHIANEAPFTAIRYFVATPHAIGDKSFFSTKIKDVSEGLKGATPEGRDFLHKYMTLTRCDLFFADKAILIEGSSERLLLPSMIRKMEDSQPPEKPKLSSQYISIMEVGGAYANQFEKLLNFLELRTLIITDIDSVKDNGKGRFTKCKVTEGVRTSNSCIKDWFAKEDITPQEILQKNADEKVKDSRRIAYQIPETGGNICGRSFEQAFIVCNPQLFELEGNTDEEKESSTYDEASNYKKTDFALKYALEESNWITPLYIQEGLLWLNDEPVSPDIPVALPITESNGKKVKKAK